MLDIASAFATIVGLMASFKAENQSKESQGDIEFTQWLIEKGHKSLADDISANHFLNLQIKNLLMGQHEKVMEQFGALNRALAFFASRLEGFKDIAAAISENDSLSDQAFSILQQLEEAEASNFMELLLLVGTEYRIADGKGGSLSIKEQRFIEDDLSTLTTLGFLKPSVTSGRYRTWHITRNASELVRNAGDTQVKYQ